jgi:PPP family 3-phenylpropionic acid transporter
MVAHGPVMRVALFYVALYSLWGVLLPFLPVWLARRGLDEAQVGWVFSAVYLASVPGNLLIARNLDRLGGRRVVMRVGAAVVVVALLCFPLVNGLLGHFVVAAALGMSLGFQTPLIDGLTLLLVGRDGYGRVRAWGSLAFIAGVTGLGAIIAGVASRIWVAAVACAIAMLIASFLLPATEHEDPAPRGESPAPVTRTFVAFLLTCACIQGSHAVYYGFGSLHWLAHGHAEWVVGLLWAEGVIAEIALFVLLPRVVSLPRAPVLIGIGGLGAVLRWSLLGSTVALPWLLVAQVLHAASFACTHLGAMAWMIEHVPASRLARAQAVYTATMAGLGLGMMGPIAGALYRAVDAGAFYFAAGAAAVGLVVLSLWARQTPTAAPAQRLPSTAP